MRERVGSDIFIQSPRGRETCGISLTVKESYILMGIYIKTIIRIYGLIANESTIKKIFEVWRSEQLFANYIQLFNAI